MKTKLINGVLWAAFILAMAASIQHLSWTFGTVERKGFEWLGWIPAVAVDAGLAALAYTIQQRKRAKRPVTILWGGVAGFALVSAVANFYHALAVEGFALVAGPVMIAKAVVLSATLPVAYIFLGEIISGDDATAAERAAKQVEKEARQAEREQDRLDKIAETERLTAERLLLEAEQAAKVNEPAPVVSEPERIPCPVCEQMFSRNGLNAHMRVHSNGNHKTPVAGER